ncbi:MAG: FMN-binding protein, partial [Leifsonia sp.]
AAPAPAAPAPTSKTVDGAVAQTPYGPLQVRITATGKKITAVTLLQSPNDRDRSVEINAQATPILAQEVLKSQSANIDTVSGATYTSDGYRQSVQSAIDKL